MSLGGYRRAEVGVLRRIVHQGKGEILPSAMPSSAQRSETHRTGKNSLRARENIIPASRASLNGLVVRPVRQPVQARYVNRHPAWTAEKDCVPRSSRPRSSRPSCRRKGLETRCGRTREPPVHPPRPEARAPRRVAADACVCGHHNSTFGICRTPCSENSPSSSRVIRSVAVCSPTCSHASEISPVSARTPRFA